MLTMWKTEEWVFQEQEQHVQIPRAGNKISLSETLKKKKDNVAKTLQTMERMVQGKWEREA